YGHLHIPRTTWYDGVRFEEVSVGYPRERRQRGGRQGWRPGASFRPSPGGIADWQVPATVNAPPTRPLC
ncbi:hypothetical protein GTV15_15710, partial [Streptomyces sp. SID7803]|nr:hypothetical protein [Streptomyces sp. SID7803]